MKVNIWRIGIIITFFFLIVIIWFLLGANENVKRDNSFLKGEKINLEKKIENLYAQKDSLEKGIVDSKKEKKLLLSKMDEYKAENGSLLSNIDKMQAELLNMNSSIAEKEKAIEALKGEIGKHAAANEELRNRISTFSSNPQGIELAPITVGTEAGALNARVMEVNKDFDFIVIDAGRNRGVKEGDILFVFRNSNLLGRITIEKTTNDVSIAKALYKSLKDVIEKGDIANY